AIMKRLDGIPPPTGGGIGRIVETREPVQLYVDCVEKTVGGRAEAPLRGLSLVMDCANGAAYELGPTIFRDLGADVTVIHADPDGLNINVQCGSTKPAEMAQTVVR